jgi:hypothetical protein
MHALALAFRPRLQDRFPRVCELTNRVILILGMVEETRPVFAAGGHPDPGALIAFDPDSYHSTKAALRILEFDTHMLLPRVHCSFDDITGFPCSDYDGGRLASDLGIQRGTSVAEGLAHL